MSRDAFITLGTLGFTAFGVLLVIAFIMFNEWIDGKR